MLYMILHVAVEKRQYWPEVIGPAVQTEVADPRLQAGVLRESHQQVEPLRSKGCERDDQQQRPKSGGDGQHGEYHMADQQHPGTAARGGTGLDVALGQNGRRHSEIKEAPRQLQVQGELLNTLPQIKRDQRQPLGRRNNQRQLQLAIAIVEAGILMVTHVPSLQIGRIFPGKKRKGRKKQAVEPAALENGIMTQLMTGRHPPEKFKNRAVHKQHHQECP